MTSLLHHGGAELSNEDETEAAPASSSLASSWEALQEPLLPTFSSTVRASTTPTTTDPAANDDTVWIVDGLPWKTSYLIKSLYFVEALGSATWGRFGTIYYAMHGLNPQQIGLLEGLMTAVPTLCMPLWGLLADVYTCRKLVYVITKAVSTILLLSLAVPTVYQSYAAIVAVSLWIKAFTSQGLLDSYTLDLLGTVHQRLYGRYRLFASLSWGSGAILMGLLTDHYGSFEPNFILYGLLGFACLGLVVGYVPNQQRKRIVAPVVVVVDAAGDEEEEHVTESPVDPILPIPTPSSGQCTTDVEPSNSSPTTLGEAQEETTSTSDQRNIWNLLSLAVRPRVFMFLVQVTVMGACMATVERLLFLYLVQDLQSSTTLCGLTVGINVLFELPIFWHATWFLQTLGLDGMQLLAQTCFVVRVYGYTLLQPSTRWYILPLESLHGVTFACFWTVATDVSKSLIHETKPPGVWSTTIPAVVQMLYSAVGTSLGSAVGGWAMQHYGSRPMYRAVASIMFCLWICQVMGSVVVRCGRTRVVPVGTDTTTTSTTHGSRSFLPDYTTPTEVNHSTVEEGNNDDEVRQAEGPSDRNAN